MRTATADVARQDRQRPVLIVLAALASVVGVMSISGDAAACSGAMVTFDQVNAGANRIVVGTVRAVRGDPAAPDGLAITVESVVRGRPAQEVLLLPPSYMGCDGRIAEPVGARLVIATGPRYFDAGPPEDLHPYWLIGAAGVLIPAGVDDPNPQHRTLDDLVAALGGELTPIASAVPGEAAAQAAVTDPGEAVGVPLAAVIGGLIAATITVFAAAMVAARRSTR
jgi:hypothetical protein